jgi:hypothetical protein
MSDKTAKKAARNARRKANRKEKGREAQKMGPNKPIIVSAKNSRPVMVVKGKGTYRAGRPLEEQDYGTRLGATLGEGVGRVFGFGEYKVRKNSLMNQVDWSCDPPVIKNRGGEGTVIRHREFVGNLVSGTFATGTSSPFALNTFQLNIGNSDLFPFGAAQAQNYQEWEVNGIMVELKSLASEYTNTVSLGDMFAAVDYNSLDVPPLSTTELLNMEYAVSAKPSKTMLMPVECARKNDVLTHLYVSLNGTYDGGDPRLFDIGTLYVGSEGVPASGAIIAQIWITYEVVLYKPHIGQHIGTMVRIQRENASQIHVFGLTPKYKFDPDGMVSSLDGVTMTFTPAIYNTTQFVVMNWNGAITGINHMMDVVPNHGHFGLVWKDDATVAEDEVSDASNMRERILSFVWVVGPEMVDEPTLTLGGAATAYIGDSTFTFIAVTCDRNVLETPGTVSFSDRRRALRNRGVLPDRPTARVVPRRPKCFSGSQIVQSVLEDEGPTQHDIQDELESLREALRDLRSAPRRTTGK